MSRVHFKRKDFKQAVKLNLIALLIFKYLEMSEMKTAMEHLKEIKESIKEKKFKELIKEVMEGVNDYLEELEVFSNSYITEKLWKIVKSI